MADEPDNSKTAAGGPGREAESTVELLALYRSGDGEALNRLFARYLSPLRQWASRRLPDWARDAIDTDDLVQETLLQTFNRIDNFEPEASGSLHAYMRRAVINRIRDAIRSAKRRPRREELKAEPGHRGPSPLEEAVGKETLDRFENALGRLRTSEQELIVARVDLGFTFEEIAGALAMPSPDAARKAAQRALVRLAEEMSREE